MTDQTGNRRRGKKTVLLPTARAEFLDPDAPLPQVPAAPPPPGWIPDADGPRVFKAYVEDEDDSRRASA